MSDDLWMIGTGQPVWPPARDRADYAGTMFRPPEARLVADMISDGRNPMPATIDHAGLKGQFEALVPEAKRIGRAVHGWHDPELGLMTAVRLNHDHPDAATVRRELEGGEKLGFSFFTDYMEEVDTGKVVKLRPTHIGVTKRPAWAKVDDSKPVEKQAGSWCWHWGTNEAAMRDTIRRHYATRPGVYLPPTLRAHLAQTESADRLHLEARRAARERKSAIGTVLVPFFVFPPMAEPAAAVVTPPVTTPPPPTAVDAPVVPAATETAPSKATTRPPPTELAAKWAAARKELEQKTNRLDEYQSALALQQEIERALSGGEMGYLDFAEHAAPLASDLKKRIETLKQLPRDYMQQQLESGKIDPFTHKMNLDALEKIGRGPLYDDASRVLCQAVYASADDALRDQKRHEVAREDNQKLKEQNQAQERAMATLKREMEEHTKKLAEMQKLVDERLKVVNSAESLAASKQQQQAPAAAVVAATPAPLKLGAVGATASSVDDAISTLRARVAQMKEHEARHPGGAGRLAWTAHGSGDAYGLACQPAAFKTAQSGDKVAGTEMSFRFSF